MRRLILWILNVAFTAAFRPARLHPLVQTRLQLDIFGLGPAEVVIIAGAAALLFGPGRLKEQLREKGIKGAVVSKGYKAEREERIALMIEKAEKERKRRAWERVNLSLSIDENGEVAQRLQAYESKLHQQQQNDNDDDDNDDKDD